MKRSPSLRMLFALFYVGAVFAVGGFLYQRLAAFSGEMPIALGKTEKTVVRPSRPGQIFVGMQRNMPLDVLAFDHPETARQLLDTDVAYDAMTLPFRLRLQKAEVLRAFPPRDMLRVRTPDGVQEFPIRDGGSVSLEDEAFAVTLRRWKGLVRHPKGQAMAAFSLRRPGEAWTEYLFLDTENWLHVAPDVGIRFRWHKSEEEARNASAAPPQTLLQGRWGVVDGSFVHWSTSFVPGTGHVLHDGTEAALVSFQEQPPRITVQFTNGGQRARSGLEANARDPDNRLRFEWPAAWGRIIVADAWREGLALVSVYESGARGSVAELDARSAWQPDGFAYELRLDQVMGGALPVTDAEDPVFEALLLKAGEEIALRQGEGVRRGAAMLQYRRTPAPPEVCYTLCAIPLHGGEEKTFSLAPGGRERVGDWLFSARADRMSPESAVLRAERTLGSPVKLLGMALFAIGAFGLVIVRFGRRGESAGDEHVFYEDNRGDDS
ncbi:MAG: hypothetical protein KA184_06160 [Candidatus Hydrogenedentes bacterium]|nr:hypothetical protein [Candidatus Hydrogenedentota bacterium]